MIPYIFPKHAFLSFCLSNIILAHSQPLLSYFILMLSVSTVNSKKQTIWQFLLLIQFEHGSSGDESDCSANCAQTTYISSSKWFSQEIPSSGIRNITVRIWTRYPLNLKPTVITSKPAQFYYVSLFRFLSNDCATLPNVWLIFFGGGISISYRKVL